MGDIHSRDTIAFLIAVANHLPGSTLREEWLIQLTVQRASSMVGKAWWQEHKAVGHIASTVNVGI